METSATERWLKLILRIFGTSALAALVFVAAPYSWMDGIHQWLGLGKLPSEPIKTIYTSTDFLLTGVAKSRS